MHNPSDFVNECYQFYLKKYNTSNNLNSLVFEQIIINCLLNWDIKIFYTQAKLTFIPNIIYDLVLYNRTTPVILSFKTSLRERWKQADLEGMVFKNVYRKGIVYLINYSKKENLTRNKKNDQNFAIDQFIYAGGNDFNHLIQKLKTISFYKCEKIPVFQKFVEYKNTKAII